MIRLFRSRVPGNAGRVALLAAVTAFSLATLSSAAEQSLKELLDQLRYPREPGERLRAAEAVAQYGEHAVPSLCRLLAEGDELVRSYAGMALVRIGARAEAAVPDLIKIGGNPDEREYLREVAITALGQIGPAAAPALPMLEATLREPLSPEFHRELVGTLAAIATPEAVALLMRLLEQGDRQEQQAILSGFSAQGCKARAAAAALLAFAARHPDDDLCDEVFLTVTAFGREGTAELALYLQSDRLEIRRRAALALSRLGADAVDAMPILCEILNAEEPLMRFWAAATLGKIGPAARQATAALQSRLGDHDPNVRWGATAALARIDLMAIREQDWNRLLSDSHPGVRRQAATIRAMIP